MKPILSALALCLAGRLAAGEPPTYQVLTAGPDSRLVEETRPAERAGEASEVSRYWQLETGLNYPDEQGQWQPTEERFEIVEGAAIAWKGRHRVTLAGELNSEGSVQFRLPSGELLRSHVYGLAYFNAATGEAVLIAEVKDTQAWLVAPNQVLYPDAFTGVEADVRYTYAKNFFEQDIILRQAPPAPADLGWDPADVRLEVWTEFVEAPTPARTATLLSPEGAAPEAWPLVDETLEFRTMRMGPGKSFRLGLEDEALSAVAKQWVQTEAARTFLVETVGLPALGAQLQELPAAKGGAALRSRVKARQQVLRQLPRREKVTAGAMPKVRRLEGGPLVAQARRPGLVVDYSLTLGSSLTNQVFRGDYTYLVTGPVDLLGTNSTFEGGAVFKFTNSATARLNVNTPVTWKATAYRPVVLTARDDHSVGEKIGTGSLSGYYAGVALSLNAATNVVSNFNLAHLRIAHARTALGLNTKSGHVFSHLQLVNCQNGISPTNADFSLRNALFHNVGTNFYGLSSTSRVEHLTVNGATWFNHGSTLTQAYLTNTLLVGVTNYGNNLTTNKVMLVGSGAGVFQSVVAGANYLADGSPYRNVGTTALNPALATELKATTTFPPAVLTGHFNATTVLAPRAPRDTDLPDLGYHYPALDYLWANLGVTNATLVLTNGVAVAAYGPQWLKLVSNGAITSVGRPDRLNRITTFHTVQEQPQAWITNVASFNVVDGPPKVTLRFTDVSLMSAADSGRKLLAQDQHAETVEIRDGSVRGAYWWHYNGGGFGVANLRLLNSVLERCYFTWFQGSYSADTQNYLSLTLRNCLFTQSTLLLKRGTSGYGAWNIHDNLFDGTDPTLNFYSSSSVVDVRGYNGFTGASDPFGGTGSKLNLLNDFQTGPLGPYYYPTSGATNSLASLINADATRTSGSVSLYHYTTRSDRAKDGATDAQLDVGFHYVATDANGVPLDADADGLPDYFEDANGNGAGTPDAGETDWDNGYNSPNALPGGGLVIYSPLR
jgi:hypothetical protein